MRKSVATADLFKDGIRVITTPSWQDFRQRAIELKSKRGFVWRGQTQDWPLLSSFDRKVATNNAQDRINKLKAHLEDFRKKMDKKYPKLLPGNDLDVWALAQHYGLKTPFLDWTSSPYIAAYFAFIEPDPNPNTNYRYVYALDRTIERLVSKLKRGKIPLFRQSPGTTMAAPWALHAAAPRTIDVRACKRLYRPYRNSLKILWSAHPDGSQPLI